MIAVTKVIENIIEGGKRLIKFSKFGENDTAKAYRVNEFGSDSSIPDGYKAIYIETSNSSEPICIGYINEIIIDELNKGDKQIYSTDEEGAEVKSFVKLLNTGDAEINANNKAKIELKEDGSMDLTAMDNTLKMIGSTIEMLGSSDNIAGFKDLKIGFDLLVTEIKAAFTIFGAHTHVTVALGAPNSPTTTPMIPPTATIDACKKTNLKTE